MAGKLGQITKLKGSENYQGWVIMAKAYLLREGLFKVITSAKNTYNQMQEKSLADIILICEYDTANHIQACKTGFEAQKTLKDLYNLDGFMLGFYNLNPASVVRTVWLDPRSRSAAASVDLHS